MSLSVTQPVSRGYLEGWRLTGLICLALVLGVVAISLAAGGGIEGIRLAIRSTARTSLVLFLLAFTASSLAYLLPGALSRWQLRNRRYFGVSFAISHLVHAVAIMMLFQTDRPLFWTLTNVVNITNGSIAYAFIVLMAATSFDRTAAWLGPRRWRMLHNVGIWYIAFTFLIAFGKRIPADSSYVAPTVLVSAAIALRLVARRMARRTEKSPLVPGDVTIRKAT